MQEIPATTTFGDFVLTTTDTRALARSGYRMPTSRLTHWADPSMDTRRVKRATHIERVATGVIRYINLMLNPIEGPRTGIEWEDLVVLIGANDGPLGPNITGGVMMLRYTTIHRIALELIEAPAPELVGLGITIAELGSAGAVTEVPLSRQPGALTVGVPDHADLDGVRALARSAFADFLVRANDGYGGYVYQGYDNRQ